MSNLLLDISGKIDTAYIDVLKDIKNMEGGGTLIDGSRC